MLKLGLTLIALLMLPGCNEKSIPYAASTDVLGGAGDGSLPGTGGPLGGAGDGSLVNKK